MKKNINPLVAVAALLVVGGVIYAVFNALTQTGTTTNPALSNRVPDYARAGGWSARPPAGTFPRAPAVMQPVARRRRGLPVPDPPPAPERPPRAQKRRARARLAAAHRRAAERSEGHVV
jgi:hypothetical protein